MKESLSSVKKRTSKFYVIKSDGRKQKFSIEKIIEACVRADVPESIAKEIAISISKKVYDGIKTKEIRKMVVDELEKRNPAWAEGFEFKNKVFVRVSAAFTSFDYGSAEGTMYEPFVKSKIVKSLVKETGMSEELANEISKDIFKFLVDSNVRFLSGHLIREIACYFLLQRGLEEYYKKYTRVGLPVFDIDYVLKYGFRENANLQYNAETIHKLIADEVMKEYALTVLLPKEVANAHLMGDIHIHQLDYFATRPFCLSHDLRFFFKNGLKVDGSGAHTAVCGPAKHANVAILHAAKVLAASQTNCGGGQGFDFFNVFLAPFLRGLDYKEIKQLAQMFLYELCTMYVSRGGQPIFSSISLEFEPPDYITKLSAVKPGGVVGPETYSDYIDEAKTFLKAITEVYLEGDYVGKMFEWPKPEYKIRKAVIDGKCDDLFLLVSKLVSKFGSPYFLNMAAPYMPQIVNSQCCRFFLSPTKEEMRDIERGSIRSSAIGYVTINLPRCAYLAKGNDEKLFGEIEKRMQLAKKALEIKNQIIRKRLEQGALPFLSQDCYGEYYYPIEHCSHNFGFVGLNEMLKAHVGKFLHEDKEAWRFGLKVVKFMADKAEEYNKENNLRFNVVQTPAESTAHRLAMIDYKLFKNGFNVIVQGNANEKSVYYTNSSHVYVGADIPLWDRIKIESSFHPLVQGGAIMHVWLGEREPDPSAVMEMTRKIARESLAAYWAYTRDFTVCRKCNYTSGGLREKCPNCGSGKEYLDMWSRITGYYSNVSNWNPGKIAELRERYRYGVS
ncbi:MAG: anaerobic ribonucleoside-triphosphate reductase [Candidatus Parvarchaeota archaeon]|nr:anaerobic ribonucleoside-triphosphate reductase [Candidatus Jingweiarchaeum tengchongense]MCW1298371.1 anaerobic ribonucleoside-triphosphate reductase [Candidatus Jingweiarchaeum tengchongense]MCW1300327.1 anaerobic ribonucleoside-triphosphate reductase [Candidatus Jingweiarchaeum tengchongense]MCW1304876.1 anaerobic ribonucleoside-triphosphate reductase [Candidatus Jingweiarchaeum tengchongense]MCW1305823.1 anaerobic ribonucleoside-triphosphate reductase [Candidatus Jingweiarchaeum tengchon